MAAINYETLSVADLKRILFAVPDKYAEKDENELKFWYRPEEISIEEYCSLILDKFVNTNDKCNRLDREEEGKKEGILSVVFKNGGLPDISLCWKKDEDGNWYLAVNDGGHRSRTFAEFLAEGSTLRTGKTCYFIGKNGNKIKIGGLTWSEVKENYPAAAKEFLEYPLSLTLNKWYSATDRKEDFDDRNKISILVPPEFRNSYDENVIADWIRFTCSKWENVPESSNFNVNPLFNKDIIGFKNTKMVYDDILAKIFLICANETVFMDHSGGKPGTDNALDTLYLEGSYAGGDAGLYWKNERVFKKVKKSTEEVLDFLYGVLSNWPKKNVTVPKNYALIWALVRFYVCYKEELLPKNATLIWNKKIAIDYKKFVPKFIDIFKKISSDGEFEIWTSKEKIKRAKGEAFKGYLGEFYNISKIRKSWEWIKEELPEDEREMGITLYDVRESFSKDDKYAKWLENGKKDSLGNKVDFELLDGDHDIPRSRGIRAGGVTEPENLKLLTSKDNNAKSDKYTFKEYKKMVA